jgi:hypothetical protein
MPPKQRAQPFFVAAINSINMPYSAIMLAITNLLKNKWFWYAVFAAIIFYVIRRNWYNIQQFSAPSFVEPTKDDKGNTITITAERQKSLRKIASDLYLDIYGWNGWDNYDSLEKANACTDAELKYVAQYYASVLNKANKGESLYNDLNGEVMPFTQLDNKVTLRLAQMGLL